MTTVNTVITISLCIFIPSIWHLYYDHCNLCYICKNEEQLHVNMNNELDRYDII